MTDKQRQPSAATLHIANAIVERPQTPTIVTATMPTPVLPLADDFDELASMIERLRTAAHSKLMRLAEEQKAAKSMLTEIEGKIAAHLRQCTSLGIDLGNTRDLTSV